MTTEELAEALPQWLKGKVLIDMPFTATDPWTGAIRCSFTVMEEGNPNLPEHLKMAGDRPFSDGAKAPMPAWFKSED